MIPPSASISAPTLVQAHSLDCEAAALEIALAATGIHVTQDWVIGQVGADLRPPVLRNGVPVRWGDPYTTFVGNIDGSEPNWTGYGVYYPPITRAAQVAGALAFGQEGWTPQQLFQETAAHHPVVVWVPHLLEYDPTGTWTAWDGRTVWYALGEHAQVLVAYSLPAATVTLDDPLDGRLHTYSMSLFETRLAQWHGMGVVVGAGPPGAPTAVTAVAAGPGTVNVRWQPPPFTSQSVNGYLLTVLDSSGRQLGRTLLVTSPPVTLSGLGNGAPLYFGVAAASPIGVSPTVYSNSVTPLSGAAPAAATSVMSTDQYRLPNSDGSTWQVMDEAHLAFTFSSATGEEVLFSANADLWTAASGFGQEMGIEVTPGGGSPALIAWQESGGNDGTFSPNAATVQGLYPVTAGTPYTVQIVWKTNVPAIGATIFAGAGRSGPFSPTRLTAIVLPAGRYSSAESTRQYQLTGSNGSSWTELDHSGLVTPALRPSATTSMVVRANADLWTANAGFNQDLGIFASKDGGAPILVGWEESGGIAGTYSPNAAMVEAVYPVSGGHTYSFSLWWKTNRPASGASIFAGAGPVNAAFSPSQITAYVLPANAAPTQWSSAVSTQQYQLTGSDGSTWKPLDAGRLAVAVTVPGAGVPESAVVSGNASLWTTEAGFNQDLGILVSEDGGPAALVAWKESGGTAAGYSPNAAFVEAVDVLLPGHSYVFTLAWKANRAATADSIVAGAGSASPSFSPTSLAVLPQL